MELPLPGEELPARPDKGSQDSAGPNMEHNMTETSSDNGNSDEFVTMVRPNRRRNRQIRFDDFLMGIVPNWMHCVCDTVDIIP